MSWKRFMQYAGGLHYGSNQTIKNLYDLDILNGCNVDEKLGSITKDLGYSQIGSTLQSGKNITGLFNFRQSASVQKMLATVNDSGDADTQLFRSTGGAWTEITTAETAWANKANINVEMEPMDAYCYFVGWGSVDGFLPVGSLTGTTFSTSTNVTNMPSAKYIKRYRDRIYIANCDISATAYPYRIYFSTIPSSGSITWTVATNFLDVDYSEYITGLGENWDRLLVFTEYSTYHYNQSQWKKFWDVGCSNHRTIRNHGAFTYWANSDGVWRSSGGQPQNISEKIRPFIKAATPTSFFSEIVDEEYKMYLGNVTVDGNAYVNLEVSFNIPHETWKKRELADTLTVYGKYNNSGKIQLWHGDSDGEVMKRSKYTDATPIYADDGAAIKAHFRHIVLDFGIPEHKKRFSKIVAFAEKAQGLKLTARVVDKNLNTLTDWKNLGECKAYINEFTVDPDRGNFLQVQGRERSINESFIFDGYVVDVDIDSITD